MSVINITLPSGYEDGAYEPALDLTGLNVDNLVPQEVQEFTANNYGTLQVFVPVHSPFYANSNLNITYTDDLGNSRDLVLGIDYGFGFPFIGASRAIEESIFGCIVLYDSELNGSLSIDYQTLGGVWRVGQEKSQATLNFRNINPYWATWEKVVAYYTDFPIIDTAWDRVDKTSRRDIVASLNDSLEKAVSISQQESLLVEDSLAHVKDLNNPHQNTKETIGLSNVENYPQADAAALIDTSNSTSYVGTSDAVTTIRAAVPPATSSASGLVMMNNGLNLSDGVDDTKPLSTRGFIVLLRNRDSELSKAFNKSQIPVRIPGWPLTFPVMWKGNQYGSLDAWVKAVSAFVSISPIEYDYGFGTLYFPSGTTIPDLTTQ